MTITHSSRIRIFDSWTHEESSNIGAPKDTPSDQNLFEVEFDHGTGENQAQDMFHARRTVQSNNEDSLDLAGGITDVFGNTITLAKLRQLIVKNTSSTSGENLVIGGGPDPTGGALITDLFDGDSEARIKLRAGGIFVVVAPLDGYTITGGSADVLRVFNNGTGDISYDIILKGTRS